MAPTARFIWPMAMMIICEKAISVLTAIASSRTWMLSGDRKDGLKRADDDDRAER